MSIVGMSTEILDGKLNPKPNLPEDVTLVIDRAFDGPSDELYLVTDTEKAKVIYGKTSPIIQAMRHAYVGGATNVVLYRIGGSGASIDNLFGSYTTIKTTSQKVGAGSTLKVYAGPRASEPGRSVIIVTDGNKIVYSNSPGQTVDLGVVQVEGFDALNFPYQVGTLTAPVDFANVVSNLKKKGKESFTATAAQTAFTLTTPATNVVAVTKTVGLITTVVAPADYTVTTVGETVTGVTLATGVDEDDVIEVQTLTLLTAPEIADAELVYTPAKDSTSITLNKLYELYDQAFVNLETVDVFGVTIADLFNCRNIAAGDDDSADRLTYVNRTDTDYGFTYEWSTSKNIYQLATDALLTTNDPALAAIDDLGQPIVVKQYHEVDFAHRLATWAYTQSTSSTYVNANIGAKGPVANYTVAINRWVGKAPVTNIYGVITENGEGLLGNRFMAGTTTRSAGFYATDSGYPDGTPRYDSSGVIIDIGKFLSINVMPVYITSESFSGESVFVRSASAVYSGLVTRTVVGDSTTNQILPNVTAVFKLKQNKVEALSALGYVALEEKSKGLTVYSGDLATQDTSDYDYISTAISVSYVVSRLKIVTDPYIGRGISEALMAALYNAIESELKDAMTRGYINGYGFNLLTTSAHELSLPLSLKAKGELRNISMVLSLSDNNLYSI